MKRIMALMHCHHEDSACPSEVNGHIKAWTAVGFALLISFAHAFPSQAEIKQATAVVGDLVAEDVKAANDGKTERAEVAAKILGYVDEAETVAAKWVLLKHAFIQYAKAANYAKAAEVMNRILAGHKDIPPAMALSLIERNAAKANAENAPDLVTIRQWLKMKIRCENVLKSKKATKLQKAEATCLLGNWDDGLRQLSALGGPVGKIAAGEKSGSMPVSKIADFWWEYKSNLDTYGAFKAHAVELYREGIESGNIAGLYKSVAEKRIAELADNVVSISYSRNPYETKGLVAMWDGEWNAGFRKHDGKALVWKNLGSLGKAYDATRSRQDVMWKANSAEFHRGGSCFKTPDELLSTHLKGEWSFEVVFSPENGYKEDCSGVAGVHEMGKGLGIVLGQSDGVSASSWWTYWPSVGWQMPYSVWQNASPLHVTVVGSVSGNRFFVYVNEEKRYEHSLSASTGALSYKGPFLIGRAHPESRRTFDGQIHCVRVYNRPLSEAEIKKNNAVDKQRFGIK